jgi:mycothiol synthase
MNGPQLIMYRRDLLNLPPVDLPDGYSLRAYADGDEAALTPVFQECFDLGWSSDRVVKTFIENPCWSPGRMCVLVHGGEIVGTATAWESPERRGHGLVHYVAVRETHRGKGLGKAITARVLEILERMGYTDAWLSTDDWRLGAIKVYLDLGFTPVDAHPSHRERWQIVKHKLGLGRPNP